MELLGALIGVIMVIVLWYTGQFIGKAISNYRQETKAIEASKAGFPELDEEGSAKTYDAHYTRDLEIAGGLDVKTKCDDTSCKKCYWKPRMLTKHEDKLHGHLSLLQDRDTFIESLPDDMSDDMYDFLYQDWLEEQLPLVRKIEAKQLADRILQKRIDDEKYYATPYHLIQQYKAEGREFSKQANSWGPATKPLHSPKPPKPSKGGPTSSMSNSEFSQRLAELRKTMDKINEDIAKAKLATYDYKRNKSL